jgi:ABC-type transport system substrate-binding protein
LKLVGRNLYYETLSEHRDEFDLVISRTYSDLWMPHGFLAEFFGEIPGKTVSKFWTDPEMRDLVRAATREMDADKRKAMYDEVMTRISGSDLTVPLYFQESYFFARKDSVGNFAPGASSYNPVDWLTLEAK